MKLTMVYSGHVHELMYLEGDSNKDTILTNCKEYSGRETANLTYRTTKASFPNILVSRKSIGQQLTYPETVLDTHFIGLAVTADDKQTMMQYTNEKNEIVKNIISPWFSDRTYGDRIVVKNKVD